MRANRSAAGRALAASAMGFLAAMGSGCGSSSASGGNAADGGGAGARDGASTDGASSGDGMSATASIDCTSATTYCIAADVVRSGTTLHCATMSATSGNVSRLTSGTPSWSLGCDDPANELSVAVGFPVQTAGPFSFMATPGSASSTTFSVDAFDLAEGTTIGSMTESSTNLVSGMLSGLIDAHSMGTGKLTASWGEPDNSCTSGEPGNPCEAGSLTLTFHVPLP